MPVAIRRVGNGVSARISMTRGIPAGWPSPVDAGSSPAP